MGMLEQAFGGTRMDVLPDANQLELGKRCWNLVAFPAAVEFCLCTDSGINITRNCAIVCFILYSS